MLSPPIVLFEDFLCAARSTLTLRTPPPRQATNNNGRSPLQAASGECNALLLKVRPDGPAAHRAHPTRRARPPPLCSFVAAAVPRRHAQPHSATAPLLPPQAGAAQ